MATAKTSLRQRPRGGAMAGKLSKVMSLEASPDSKCPICLDCFNNRSYLDLCLHKFCFRCIHEWSKNKAECPLCKQPFNAIYHSIKSETDFKKYHLRPTENGSFGNFGGERFRYRTTLTGARRQAQGRTSASQYNGVMFERVVTGPVPAREERSLRRVMVRLAARRRAESEGRVVRALREQEMVRFRRALYRHGVKVRSVRDGGRSRDTSAQFYQRNPACLHRLVPWLKRELLVLYGTHGSLVNIVQHIIMSRITRFDMEDGAMQEELRPFLQARTEHFLHEFISFARAPFNMEAYDQHAAYDCPAPSSSDDGGGGGGSSTDSSVIAISEDEDGERGGSVELDPAVDSLSGGALSQTVWEDDETPGPSYSTTSESGRAPLLSIRDSESNSSLEEEEEKEEEGGGVCAGGAPRQKSLTIKADKGGGEGARGGVCASSDDEDDCVIVGFVKPLAERTPELVKLSSDSEESGQEEEEEEEEEEKPRLPQHIRFSSLSPASTTQSHAPCKKQTEEEEGGGDGSAFRKSHDTSSSPGCRRGPSGRSDGRRRRRGGEAGRHRRQRSRDGSRERRGRRSRSGERCRSASGDVRGHAALHRGPPRRSRSPSRERRPHVNHGGPSKRGDRDGGRPGRGHGDGASCSPPPPQRSTRSLYGTERSGRAGWRSHLSSGAHRDPDRRSHSRSRSRESHRRERRRSRTRSGSSSAVSPSQSTRSRHDKPGGKRKYKTRHLEELPVKETTSARPSPPEPDSSSSAVKERKRSKEKRGRRWKEKSTKRSRSLSVEIVYERSLPLEEHAKRHQKKKRRHRKKSRRHRSKERTGKSSPSVITIDSDSDHAKHADRSGILGSDAPPIKTTVTGNPADSSLLESMLQNWEKQVSPPVSDHKDLKPECPFTAEVSEDSVLEHSDNVPRSKEKEQPLSSSENKANHPRSFVADKNILYD